MNYLLDKSTKSKKSTGPFSIRSSESVFVDSFEIIKSLDSHRGNNIRSNLLLNPAELRKIKSIVTEGEGISSTNFEELEAPVSRIDNNKYRLRQVNKIKTLAEAAQIYNINKMGRKKGTTSKNFGKPKKHQTRKERKCPQQEEDSTKNKHQEKAERKRRTKSEDSDQSDVVLSKVKPINQQDTDEEYSDSNASNTERENQSSEEENDDQQSSENEKEEEEEPTTHSNTKNKEKIDDKKRKEADISLDITKFTEEDLNGFDMTEIEAKLKKDAESGKKQKKKKEKLNDENDKESIKKLTSNLISGIFPKSNSNEKKTPDPEEGLGETNPQHLFPNVVIENKNNRGQQITPCSDIRKELINTPSLVSLGSLPDPKVPDTTVIPHNEYLDLLNYIRDSINIKLQKFEKSHLDDNELLKFSLASIQQDIQQELSNNVKEISHLKKTISNQQKTIKEMEENIKVFNKVTTTYKNKISELEKLITNVSEEIKDLKSKRTREKNELIEGKPTDDKIKTPQKKKTLGKLKEIKGKGKERKYSKSKKESESDSSSQEDTDHETESSTSGSDKSTDDEDYLNRVAKAGKSIKSSKIISSKKNKKDKEKKKYAKVVEKEESDGSEGESNKSDSIDKEDELNDQEDRRIVQVTCSNLLKKYKETKKLPSKDKIEKDIRNSISELGFHMDGDGNNIVKIMREAITTQYNKK